MGGHDDWRTSSYPGQNGSCVALSGGLDVVLPDAARRKKPPAWHW